MPNRLFLAGASVRAAAQSAARAGWTFTGADLFADTDVSLLGTAILVPAGAYPNAILDIAAEVQADGWSYTGCLENHPDLIDQISEHIPLWGNGGATVRRACDPFEVAMCFDKAGFPVPDTRPWDNPPREGNWLCKRRASGGGVGIRFVEDAEQLADDSYFQRFVPGRSYAAIYLAAENKTAFVGLTRQWLRRNTPPREADDGDFRYIGSAGPVDVDEVLRGQLVRLGEAATRSFGLRGILGIDVVLEDDSIFEANSIDASKPVSPAVPHQDSPLSATRVWPIEINPRFTASVEVLELASEWSALELHDHACRGVLPTPEWRVPSSERWGKRIMFAESDYLISDGFWEHAMNVNRGNGPLRYADIPNVGQTILAGRPVMTLLTHAKSLAEVENRLFRWYD